MTTPLTDEQIEAQRATFEAWAKEYGRIFLKRDGEGYQFPYTQECWVAWKGCARALLAQPSVAPPAPGGDVLERRSETGMPMSANAPEKCPITRRPFFMVISHPELGWVPTYGGPYDSYTIPHMEGKPDEPYHERELTCHHYDHDYGGWVDDESIPMRVINEGVLNALQSTQAPCPYEPHPSGICTKCGKAHAPTATQGQDAAPADRTPKDYAIEHAEYMAQNGEFLINAVNDFGKAEQEVEDGTANPSDVDEARHTCNEALGALRSGIYEFRKRAARAKE